MANARAPAADRIRGQFIVDAAIGAVAWIVIVAIDLPMTMSGHILIEHLLLFAPLVIVPLGVRLTARMRGDGRHPPVFALLAYLHPLATLAAVHSVLVEPGLPSGFVAGLWLAYCLVAATWGLLRFVSASERSLDEIAIDAGLVYLAIGGVWFVLTRLGARPLGFGDEIVALTAVHFHYAGFAAPIVVGLAGRALRSRGRDHFLRRVGTGAVVAGPIVTAIGITTNPLVELIGAFALAIALTMCMAIVALRAGSVLDAAPNVLLWTCAISLSMTMLLACVYALGRFVGSAWLDIPRMATIHGLVNVFGFALPGLLAFTLNENRAR